MLKPNSLMLPGVRRQHGFSLVELMVGLVLSLIVMFALTVLFANNSRTRAQLDQSTQQIENGRYALDQLRDDLHLAGYYGDVAPQQGFIPTSATIPDVCASAVADIAFNLSPLQWPVPVFGIAGVDTDPSCVTSPGRKSGTDILVVRRTKTAPTAFGLMNAARIYLQASGCKDELTQHKDFGRALGTGAGAFPLQKKGCTAAADAYEFQTRIYYVSDETIPTLRVLTISGTSSTNESLVEGIDDMRVQYGRDSAGNDGAPDEYRRCRGTGTGADPCSALEWANIMAVRVDLLARNIASTSGYSDTKTYDLGGVTLGPFNDGFKRHAYTAVVRLMNPAGTREH